MPHRVRDTRTFSEFALGRRRVELQDSSTAIGLGGMRAGDEGAADLGAVPAGLHAETQRLFGFDMTRREILHGMLSSLKRSIAHRAWGCDLGLRGKTIFLQLSSESRAKSASTAATR